MAARGWGLLGTVRQNRLFGVPLPGKKEAARNMDRGEMEAAYSDNICAAVWRDSQPVYMSTNFSDVEPVGNCERFAGKGKGYSTLPCPKLVLDYNRSMGGVDQLNQNSKCYSISSRLHKWYWPIYTWSLNIQMVQAWRLYRTTIKKRHMAAREEERIEEEEFEATPMREMPRDKERAERAENKRKQRREEKKKEDMGLLDFQRECVEMLLSKHGDTAQTPQREKVARMSATSQEAIRLDHNRTHMIVESEKRGKCKVCQGRSIFRCETCDICLHPQCFKGYHTE